MTRRQKRFGTARAALTLLTALSALAGTALVGAAPAGAVQGTTVAPGVSYDEFDIAAAKGTAHAHVLTVDLRNPRVRLDLLQPGAVAARATVSQQATAQGAVAGVNGDFFNISEAQHPGVQATGASVGPAIARGRALKGAVPNGQRFGPPLPPGTSTEDVFGLGVDRRARLGGLSLDGSIRTPRAGCRCAASTSTPCRWAPSGRSPPSGAASPACAPPAGRTRTGRLRAARTPTR